MCSDAPDMSGVNAAAKENADIAREALAWYKQKDAQAAPLRDEAARKAIEVADQQLASSKTQDALAQDYADYNKTTYRPLEQGIVADATSYDTPERRQEAATAAIADVNSAGAAMRDARARRLAAEGINPGSTRAMAALDGLDVEQAKASAGAARQARLGVETTGFARRMDAASLGRGLASSQATSAGLALQAGNSGVQNANLPVTNANQGTSTYGQGFGTAVSANNSSGSLYGQAASAQAAANNSGLWGALGNVAGQFAGSSAGSAGIAGLLGMSDENVKTDIEPTDPEQALHEVTSTPVSNWKYDPAKMAANGVSMPAGGEGENTGPMAQDVQATMGGDAAPGGKQINLVTMNGKLMAAVQALDKKVNNIAAKLAGGQLQAGAA